MYGGPLITSNERDLVNSSKLLSKDANPASYLRPSQREQTSGKPAAPPFSSLLVSGRFSVPLSCLISLSKLSAKLTRHLQPLLYLVGRRQHTHVVLVRFPAAIRHYSLPDSYKAILLASMTRSCPEHIPSTTPISTEQSTP
eukprot:670186-Hanusia_phi.AAC.1